jgi:SAM-dependent methyltransferase
LSEPDYVAKNRALWTISNAEYTGPNAPRAWAEEEHTWGVFGVPERDVYVLGEVAGLDVVELGCGTAYLSAWLARRGARPVGVDVTPAQLETARAMQLASGLEFPLIEANAEDVPLPDASFDLAISEYGACLWADPYRWVPEAARILRPGGELIFLVNSALLTLCMPEQDGLAASERLVRPTFGKRRIEWPGELGVEFHLSHGDWLRLLRRSGFEIEDLIEVQAPEAGTTRYPFVTLQWARQWPSEEIWKARRCGSDS